MSSCLARRLIAFLVDVALASLLYLALGSPGAGGVDPAPALLGLTWAVRTLPEVLWRRSPGTMLLRIDVAGPRWAPLIRHAWLLLPLPFGLLAPAFPWYSLLVVVLGASALLAPDHRSLADRAAHTTVIQRGAGCVLPG